MTKDESLAYEKLQTRYEDLHARVEDALEDYFQDKEARKRDNEIRAHAYERVMARTNAAIDMEGAAIVDAAASAATFVEVAEPPAAKKKAIRPKKPVAKKVVKASSAGASTIKKNLQKKTTKPTKKPSAAKKDEKPCKKPSTGEEEVEPAAVVTVLNEAEAGAKATRNPLAQLRDLGYRVVDLINKIEPMSERKDPISTPVLLEKIDDLNQAWGELVTQHDRLCVISGRGRLQGL